MRIHATLNERTVRRTFRERKIGRNGLTVIDNDLPAFALKVSKKGTRTFIVRIARKLGRDTIVLGKAYEIHVLEAREKAAAVIAHAMGYRVEPSPVPDDPDCRAAWATMPEVPSSQGTNAPEGERTPPCVGTGESERSDRMESEDEPQTPPPRPALDWL